MSPSPTANRSFLHGSRKATLISDKVVYATLDSLALKRARLPLQLLPVDSQNVADKTEKSDKEKKFASKTSPKRSYNKVKSGASHQWKNYSKYLIFSSTKSENQSVTCANRVPDSGIKIENTLKEEIQAQPDAVEFTENIVESVPVREESRTIDSRSDSCDNNFAPVTKNSREDITGNQCEEEKCSVKRKDSNSSSDYERMDVIGYKASTLERMFRTSSEISNEITSGAGLAHVPKIERNTPVSLHGITKSRSANNLATREIVRKSVPAGYPRQDASSTTSDEDDTTSPQKKKKNRRHFTKNVLHYVPRHLVKSQPKKKKKLKKYSLSTLRSFQTIPFSKTVRDTYRRTRNLTREELKCVIISSPTNFVHVASATNPSLVRNAVGSSLEQVVITHQQICATLPLLVGKDEQRKLRNEKQPKVISGMSPADDAISSQLGGDRSIVETTTDKSDRTNYAEIKSDFSGDSQLHSAKVLKPGQMVKTPIENQADSPEGETYEPVCTSPPQALPRANCSFLWSNHRVKTFPSDTTSRDTTKENAEDADSEEYDDVGPSNFAAQAESDDYDDVGPPTSCREPEESAVDAEDCEEIYDDVMPLDPQQDGSTAVDKGDYIVPGTREETSGKEPIVELRATAKAEALPCYAATMSDDQYFSTNNNEYSSVDCESYLGEEERDELGVYDDVGLPHGEERVNSLYAGSAPGSVLGLTSMNGKESEWEDLEEVSSVSCCPCQTNDPCEKGANGQAVSGKKKLAQRWSRNVRRQRSRRSRRSMKATMTRTTLGTAAADDSVSDDSTYESLYSCQPDDFSSDSETETRSDTQRTTHDVAADRTYLECPTRPTPPPPREANLTLQTLGRRIKMLRRTWSITKGSLGRIRRRTSADESGFDDKESGNEHHHVDAGKYFNFRLRHFRKSIISPPTFYLDENNRNDNVPSVRDNSVSRETIYTNSQYMGSGSDDSSRTTADVGGGSNIDHYSVLADHEPLYQFYASAVARAAFESDSEGYEEVEDIWLTLPPATDRSGQRMLWCQTPQVMHSDLLQRLTPEEKKIQEAKFEILTSEASYLNSLRVLENEFLSNHALMNETLTPIERKKLFGGVPSVLSASQAFLAELEVVWRRDPMLPGLSEVLLKHAERSQTTYVAYCSNQVSIANTLKELKNRKGLKFLDTMRRIETRPACQNLSLHSFLMLPMQRVTRLPLLADAVLSKLSMGNPDRASWENVLSTLSNVVAECNEGARAAAQEAELEALARKLEYSSKIKPIMLRGKQLVRSGSVVQLSMKTDTEYKLTFGKKFNKTPLYLLLLTDYLLVTKLKSSAHDECYTVIDACKRNLLALEPVSEESPFAGRNAMMLTLLENYSGRHVEYVLTCENKTERERWLEAVSPPKRELIGETLYESWDCPQVMAKHPYSPNQPDELSLQPGDVINVLRKMADGWYHGEKLLDGEQGWFPANYTKEVASEHVRARNLKRRHRLLALTSSVIQQRRAKENQGIH
ncbi:Ephexin-1 [Ooceraea biroi]|uniref:Ephexin-1 n=1 Tax=Ooceraea biroi TaxID=2015173 RepID=A0A026WEI7_OOCBI|nr:Ephexin-1 [Ooceraea biroi]